MKPKIIFINPWIYDFAAVNLWSKPLGLLKVTEYMSRFNIDLKFIDCTDTYDARKRKKYGTGNFPRQVVEKPEILNQIPRNFARYGISIEDFIQQFKKNLPCDFVFLTSTMCYWYPGVEKVIEIVKTLSPHSPVILGGIYATLFYQHATEKLGADFIYRGKISHTIMDVLNTYGFIPQENDHETPYYKLGIYEEHFFAPLLTSMGCPYRCSYCASHVLFTGFIQREPEEVMKEITELYDMGVADFAFYDDALLVNADSYIKIILKEVIQSGMKVRFHCPNGIHARFIDDELAYLMNKSGFATIRLGMETVNNERQAHTGGKVTREILTSAIKCLQSHGFAKDKSGVYLMYGLPGQDLQEVSDGIDFLKSLHVRINLTEFSPIPGTLCWEELKDTGTLSDTIDPLLTNNTVFSYLFTDYDQKFLEKLKLEVKQFNGY